MSSFTGATWLPAPVDPDHLDRIRARGGMSDVAARCMAIRWGGEVLDADGWLHPDPGDLHDPYAMLGMDRAVDRLRRAMRDRQRIRVVTDYDVDGTTSSLILQAALRLCAPDIAIDYHIPDRFAEGYGFSTVAAEAAADDGIDLVVTADIGVRDHAAVQAARERGLDVLICDHHLPAGADVPPDATVLCPPQAACTYPNQHLAACGVTLKLAHALLEAHPKRDAILRSMLKLAAIGTVADLVPLTTRENRAIVALGVRQLNEGRHHPGLKALIDVAGLEAGEIGEWDLGFRVGPRINAAGRVAHAKLVVELLNSRDPERARVLAGELDRLNTERKTLQRRLTDAAWELVGDAPDPFVVVAGAEEDGWHRGVVGIVAARIKERAHRPAAVVSIQGDTAVGSVRSIPGIHAVRALESAEDLLLRFGGHPAAAGFTVPTDRIDALRERLSAYVATTVPDDELVATHLVDAEVPVEQLDAPLFAELATLGPFGQGNPRPRLLVRDVQPIKVDVKGEGRLLKFRLRRDGAWPIDALWWGHAEHAPALAEHRVDVLGELAENVWRGRRSIELQVTDARLRE